MVQQEESAGGTVTELEDEAKVVFEQLDLTAEEFGAVRRQGFISSEMRRKGLLVFKLRFRLHGRQRVKYLGTNSVYAATIRLQLDRWQRSRRLAAKLRELKRAAAKLIRESKQRLKPWVEQIGMHFHGCAIRQRRNKAVKNSI